MHISDYCTDVQDLNTTLLCQDPHCTSDRTGLSLDCRRHVVKVKECKQTKGKHKFDISGTALKNVWRNQPKILQQKRERQKAGCRNSRCCPRQWPKISKVPAVQIGFRVRFLRQDHLLHALLYLHSDWNFGLLWLPTGSTERSLRNSSSTRGNLKI